MGIGNLFQLLTGVALFLFGMSLMGDGLKRVAGNKLELILYKLTGNPVKGFLFGTGITAVIQSSSATSVMVVGFVNSGMMKVRQAIPVVLGAILGTSITGWVICLSGLEGASGWLALFSTSSLTCLTAVAGIVLRMFCKDRFKNHLGDILLGFAVLMFGMSAMSGAMSELKESQAFIQLFTRFSNPLLGIAVGLAFTCVLQSASAAVGILQVLTVTGTIHLDTALPLIMGISVGAAVPVLLSAIGATREGRTVSFAYLVSNALGVVFTAAVFYGLNAVYAFPFLTVGMNVVTVALLNTVYRLVVVGLLLPLIPLIEKLSGWMVSVRKKEDREDDLVALEERFLSNPALAVEQSRKAIYDMAGRARKNFLQSVALTHNYVQADHDRIIAREKIVDRYEDRLGTYLMKVSAEELDDRENIALSKFLHTITDFERISDLAMNLADSAREIYVKQDVFSADARRELDVMEQAVKEIVNITVDAFMENDLAAARRVESLEELVDELCGRIKLNHVDRLREGTCKFDSGFVLNDMLNSFERIADHCSNIAVAMIELEDQSFDTHAYLRTIKRQNSDSFAVLLEEFREKYRIG